MKILFIHPTLRNYRIQLFYKLHNKYKIKFIFLEQKRGGIEIPDNWNYHNFDLEKGKKIVSFKNMINWLNFCFFLLKEDYDIIISSPAESFSSVISLIISKIKQKKIILWGELWQFQTKILFNLLQFKLKLFFLKRGNAIIGSGEKSSNFYMKYYDKNIVYNAPNYVPPKKIVDKTILNNIFYPLDKRIFENKVILYLSSIIERKGLDYLIKAVKLLENELPDILLLIVGNGPFKANCENLAKELKIKNIIFASRIPDEKLDFYYNICDVFVLPSIMYKDYAEPIGLVVCEALSIGKPIIVTDAVGASQYVQNGINGFIVKEKNVEELFLALNKILSDKKLLIEMGKKSKEIFNEKINLNDQYNAFETVIEAIALTIK